MRPPGAKKRRRQIAPRRAQGKFPRFGGASAGARDCLHAQFLERPAAQLRKRGRERRRLPRAGVWLRRLRKDAWMKLARELLNGVNQSRRGQINFIANYSDMAFADRVEFAPARFAAKLRETLRARAGVSEMAAREDQIIGIEPHNFFEADLRPVLFRFDDRLRIGEAQCVRDEGMLAKRSQRILPHDE